MHYVVFHTIFPSDTGFCCACAVDEDGSESFSFHEPKELPAPGDEEDKRAVFHQLFSHVGFSRGVILKPGDTVTFHDGPYDGDGFGPWCCNREAT